MYQYVRSRNLRICAPLRRSWAAFTALFSFALLATLSRAALAGTLVVGPGQALKTPSAAARVARPGDVIEIEPKAGGYYDCAVWNASNLTIEGKGSGVVLTDTTCEGKAIFVTVGDNITIRNLTFQRARVPDWNGAGIRAEGANLRIDMSRFVNNQSGILAASHPGSTITIRDSDFVDNGQCHGSQCVGAILAGSLRALRIEGSTFQDEVAGDDICSGAMATELVNDRIEGGPKNASGYFVDLPGGGSLTMRGNQLESRSGSRGAGVAVRIMEGFGALPVPRLMFLSNRVVNHGTTRFLFVSNWTATAAQMRGNTFSGDVRPVSHWGYYWFMIKSFAHYAINLAKGTVPGPLKNVARKIRSFI